MFALGKEFLVCSAILPIADTFWNGIDGNARRRRFFLRALFILIFVYTGALEHRACSSVVLHVLIGAQVLLLH